MSCKADKSMLELESKKFGVRSLMVPPLIPPPHHQTVDLYGIGFSNSQKMAFLEIILTLEFSILEKWCSWTF